MSDLHILSQVGASKNDINNMPCHKLLRPSFVQWWEKLSFWWRDSNWFEGSLQANLCPHNMSLWML